MKSFINDRRCAYCGTDVHHDMYIVRAVSGNLRYFCSKQTGYMEYPCLERFKTEQPIREFWQIHSEIQKNKRARISER